MAEAKHTPGPWEAVDSMTVRGPFAMGDSEKPGLLVAQLPNFTPAEERAANARLIAAAPELLAALIVLRESALDTIATATGWEASLDSCADAAGAAIAKATGAAA